MKVQLQDAGAKLYDVEAPDGTALDQVAEAASAQMGRELRVIDKPSMPAYAWDKLKTGLASLPAAAASLPDVLFPVGARVARTAATAMGLPDTSPAATQKRAEEAMGVEHLPAPSTLQKYLVGKPAEFLGASAIPSSGIIATAKRPLLALATELASTFGGGVGAQAGEDVGEAAGRGVTRLAGGNEETGAHIGKTIGGLGGGLSFGGLTAINAPRLLDAGGRAVARMVPKIGPESVEMTEQMNSLFTKHFREALLADPRFKANIEQTLKTRDAVNQWLETGKVEEYGPPVVAKDTPKFEPDLSMATGTGSIKFLQQLAETESPRAAAKGVENRQRVDAALSAYREGNFPAGKQSLQELSTGELSQLEAGVAAAQAKLEADMERLRGKVRSGQFGPDEGRELEALKKEQMKLATAQTDSQYAAVYKLADQFGFMGSMDPLVTYMQRYLRDPNRVAQEAPGFMGDLLGAVKAGSAQTRKTIMQQAFGEQLPEGITAFVASKGGLRKDLVGGDGLVDVTYTPPWARTGAGAFYLKSNGANARTPDAMRELAVEAGYLKPGATMDDLYRAIEEEIGAGAPVTFRPQDEQRAFEILAKRKADIDAEMGGAGAGFSQSQYPASFGVLHSVLKRIREEQRFYAGKQTDEARRAMGPLGQLEKLVLAEVEKAGPEVGTSLGGADRFFKSTVAEPFYRGVASRAFSDRGLIENVADRLMTRGEEGAANFKQVYGSGERANDLLWNGILEGLAKRLGEKDVTPARVRAFYEDHRKFLDQFPTVRDRIFAVDKAAEQLEGRAGEVGELRRAANRDLVATLTNSTDPEGRLVAALGNESQMAQVAGWAQKNPELGKSIVRTYVDAMEKMKDPAAFLAANEKSLRPVFDALGPKHWENVKNLLGGRTIEARGAPEPVLKPEVVDDPMKVLTGTGTSGIFSRIRGAVYRQISPEYVLVDVGGKYFFRVHQERAREMINQALYDPKLAENILALEKELTLPKPDSEKLRGLMREMKGHYATHGLRVALGSFSTAVEDPVEEKSRERGERAMQRYWRQ